MAQEERLCQGKDGFERSVAEEQGSRSALPAVPLGSVLLQRTPSRTLETINHSQGFVKMALPLKFLGLGYWQLRFIF